MSPAATSIASSRFFTRTGFELSVKHNVGSTNSQANYRNVHFGIDQNRIDAEWTDRGRPGNSVYVFAMTVFDGALYASTCEAGKDEAGHVFRFDGNSEWVDLGSPDPQASAAFYGGLFGWDAEMDPRPGAGGYGMFKLDGLRVAGLGPQQNQDAPPYWTVYVTVADVDASLAATTEAGGTVVMGAMDVFDAGRMAVIQDPQGTFISLWQPGEHIGIVVAQTLTPYAGATLLVITEGPLGDRTKSCPGLLRLGTFGLDRRVRLDQHLVDGAV